jgi:hypothetical protein
MIRIRTLALTLFAAVISLAFVGVTASATSVRVGIGPAQAVASTTTEKFTNTTLPQISGEKKVGGELTTTTGSWSSAPASYAFQWLLCDSSGQGCQPIPGLTTKTIAVPSTAASLRLRVRVTATASTGMAATATSHSTMLIAPGTISISQPPPTPSTGATLFQEPFNYSNGLVTNEFSYWNSNSSEATPSSVWQMTSGSLFAQNGTGWTGVPDGCSTSSAYSVPCTASDVFRLNSTEHDFGNVTVSMDLLNNYLTSSSRTPAENWDGVHIWLHYQSEYNLYYASFNRRDGHIVIKKKCLGGSENGGTYYELGQGEVSGYPIPFGVWQHVEATIQDNSNGSVTITMYRGGTQLLSATDTGVGCAPITAPGSVGVRADTEPAPKKRRRAGDGRIVGRGHQQRPTLVEIDRHRVPSGAANFHPDLCPPVRRDSARCITGERLVAPPRHRAPCRLLLDHRLAVSPVKADVIGSRGAFGIDHQVEAVPGVLLQVRYPAWGPDPKVEGDLVIGLESLPGVGAKDG